MPSRNCRSIHSWSAFEMPWKPSKCIGERVLHYSEIEAVAGWSGGPRTTIPVMKTPRHPNRVIPRAGLEGRPLKSEEPVRKQVDSDDLSGWASPESVELNDLIQPAKSIQWQHDQRDLTQLVGQTFDGFELVELLGQGGMGVVYRARQISPVKRTVAVKLIRPSLLSEAILQRFQLESQALALMNHPGIAQIHDAGITPDRSPYFVMEFVDGNSLDAILPASSWPLHSRLQFFCQLCDAVQHAHSQGVIHRDLKPSNVIVTTTEDGKRNPKVIDFGLAKLNAFLRVPSQQLAGEAASFSLNSADPIADQATGIDPATGSSITVQGAVMGTLEYMSPEQAGVSTDSQLVSIQTDVYSLGAILFELITGNRPFSRHLQTAKHNDLRRAFLDEPEPPSIADYSQFQVDARRSKLSPTMKRDLDTICSCALSFDSRERYQTAADLSREVGNCPQTVSHFRAGLPLDGTIGSACAAQPSFVHTVGDDGRFDDDHRQPDGLLRMGNQPG